MAPKIPTRAAIYTRVSTIEQGDGASLSTQKSACERYCQAQGLTVTAYYEDQQSGLKADRVQYLDMLRQAEAGAFDVICVWKMDRFGRDRLESGYQLRELQRIGVRVDSATEPNDSPLLRNILMDFAEEESRRISVRVSANKATRAQNGLRTTRAPFGYRNVPHPGGGVTLEPNDDAPVVAEAFQRYASGRYSIADILKYITEASTTPNKPRTRPGIHDFLKNATYAGKVSYGRWCRSSIRPERPESFIADGVHPAIVSQETFDLVQQRLSGNRTEGSGRPHAAFMFTGMVWCQCGARYGGKRNNRHKANPTVLYTCIRRQNHGANSCKSRSISELKVKAEVIPPIQALLGQLNQADICQRVRQKIQEEEQNQKAAEQSAKASVAGTLERMEKRLRTWLEMVADGDLSREEYTKLRAEYEPKIEELRAQLDTRPYLGLSHLDQLIDVAQSIAVDNGEITVGGAPLDQQAWRELIELWVERIEVSPVWSIPLRSIGKGLKQGVRQIELRRSQKVKVVWKPYVADAMALISEAA